MLVRRRLVVGAAVLVVAAALGWFLTSLGAAVAPAAPVPWVMESAAGVGVGGQGASGGVVVAQPGDTLWTIARRLQPAGDLRPLVQVLAELNDGPLLVAGQAVALP